MAAKHGEREPGDGRERGGEREPVPLPTDETREKGHEVVNKNLNRFIPYISRISRVNNLEEKMESLLKGHEGSWSHNYVWYFQGADRLAAYILSTRTTLEEAQQLWLTLKELMLYISSFPYKEENGALVGYTPDELQKKWVDVFGHVDYYSYLHLIQAMHSFLLDPILDKMETIKEIPRLEELLQDPTPKKFIEMIRKFVQLYRRKMKGINII